MEDKVIRIKKAIDFFRKFDDKSDREIYRKSVLKFCQLVEEYIDKPKDYEAGKEVFKGL